MRAARALACALIAGLLLLLLPAPAAAHDGPPYPIVSNRVLGPYTVSVWTDPDATDDGTAEGKFWVLLDSSAPGVQLPAETRVRLAAQPIDRPGAAQAGDAVPVQGDASNQYVAVLMDHEGRFAVRITVDGPLGGVETTSEVDATYDLRPAPALVFVYALPFMALGGLWVKVLIGRRRRRRLTAGRDGTSTA
jgi:hypothetical protein